MFARTFAARMSFNLLKSSLAKRTTKARKTKEKKSKGVKMGKQSQTTSTVYGNTTTSNPYASATTTNNGTVASLNDGSSKFYLQFCK